MSLVANAVMAQQSGAGKPRQEFKGPVKVFILAGQSNMEGHAGVQTLDRLGEHPTHGYLLKKIKNDDGSFVVRDDVFVSYQKEDKNPPPQQNLWVSSGSGRRPRL
jgi:alpha-galactosidase